MSNPSSTGGAKIPTDSELYQHYLAMRNNNQRPNPNVNIIEHNQFMDHAVLAQQMRPHRPPPVIHPLSQYASHQENANINMGIEGTWLPYHRSNLGLDSAYPPSNVNMDTPPREVVYPNTSRREEAAVVAAAALTAAQNSEQERATTQDVRYQDVLLEYSHLNTLMAEQQLLLDAHIAEVAYQRALVENQLAIENAVKEEMYERLLRGGEEGVVAELAGGESRIHESARQNCAHLDSSLQDEAQIEAMLKLSKVEASLAQKQLIGGPSDDSHHNNSIEAKSDTQNNKIREPVKQKPVDSNLHVSRGTKRKTSPTAPKIPAPPLPQQYKEFIEAIVLKPTAENIIEQFNKTIKPVEDESFLAAVTEDQESVQDNPKARHEFHQKQLVTMNHRLEMYTKLEELIDKILSEESESSGRGRNSRSNSKAHIREVTMDLIQLKLKNYQLLEGNVDRILGVDVDS